MSDKRKNIYIILFIITTILIACFSIYLLKIVKDKNVIINESEVKIYDYENKIIEKDSSLNELNLKLESYKPKDGTVTQIKDYSFVKFDVSKIKKRYQTNSPEIKVNYLGNVISGSICQVIVNSDGTVKKMIYDNKEYLISGINGKVVDTVSNTYWNGSTGFILFLMEDGTVEKSNDIYGAKEFKSQGKIEGIKDIVKIIYTTTEFIDKEVTVTRNTFMGIDKYGYAYDLFAN